MLRPFFHAWERRLASISKDRVVRPFEWGLDWLPQNGSRLVGRATPPHRASAAGTPVSGSPDEYIEHWVDDVMRDTSGFFDVPPTSDYQIEAGTLRFPSAVVTPHPANNTVVGRWFPSDESRAGSPKRREGGRAVVVLPQWNSDPEGHIGLSRLLARCGVSALRLSLPYHDSRMPPELTRADYIVSANIARTIQICRQAVLDARRAVSWLAMQGFERIGILGTSLGSCLAMLTAAH